MIEWSLLSRIYASIRPTDTTNTKFWLAKFEGEVPIFDKKFKGGFLTKGVPQNSFAVRGDKWLRGDYLF